MAERKPRLRDVGGHKGMSDHESDASDHDAEAVQARVQRKIDALKGRR